MASIDKLPSGRYRAQIRRAGLAIERQIFDDELAAKTWATAREAAIVAAHNLAKPKVEQVLTLEEAAKMYFASAVFRNKAETSQSREKVAASRVLHKLGNYSLAVLNRKEIQLYFDGRAIERNRRGKLPAGDTLRLEKIFLAAVFNFAARRDLAASNPMINNKFDLPKCKPRELRIAPAARGYLLVEARLQSERHNGNPCLPGWLALVMQTGMRPGEAAAVRLAWLDIEHKKIDVPQSGQKKRNARTVLLSTDLTELLAEQAKSAKAANSEFLFFSISSKTGLPVKFCYGSPYRRLEKKVGIKGGAHGLRHEYISSLVENTQLSDSQIALLAGDASTLSLRPYMHLRAESLRSAADAANELSKAQQRHAARQALAESIAKEAQKQGIKLPPDIFASLLKDDE